MVFVRLHMTPSPTTFEPSTLALDALLVFRHDRIRHAPILENGRLVGMLTERDLLRVLPGTVGQLEEDIENCAADATVGQAMTRNPFHVSPNDHIDDVAHLLRKEKISAVPVMKGSELIGILTSSDLFSAFERMLTNQKGLRFCLLRVPGRAPDPEFDMAQCAVEFGLHLHSLIRASYAQGGEVITVYLDGPEEGLTALRIAAQDAGLVLLQKDDARLGNRAPEQVQPG